MVYELIEFPSLKSKSLESDFDLHKYIQKIPKKEWEATKKYEVFRSKKVIVYAKNKRQRIKEGIRVRRLASLLSKKYGKEVEFYPEKNIIIVDNICYIIAEKINSLEERAFYIDRVKNNLFKRVISLKPSKYSSYFKMDLKSIRDYYKNEFRFPEDFRPYVKMKGFRSLNIDGRFSFADGRINTTSKSTMDEKFVKYFSKNNPCKIYFSLARCLNGKRERTGKGFMLKNIIYAALDIDGNCMLKKGYHLYNSLSICKFCWEDLHKKIKHFKIKAKKIKDFKIEKILFSGSSGVHVHFSIKNGKREITEKEMLDVVKVLNKGKKLVDEFKGTKGKGFDLFRIFRVPNSVSSDTCLIVKEFPLCRINISDEIVKPK